MFMTSIDLDSLDLSQARAFYSQTLGLHLRQATADSFTVQAGATALTFRASRAQSALSFRLHGSFQQVVAGQSLAQSQNDAARRRWTR